MTKVPTPLPEKKDEKKEEKKEEKPLTKENLDKVKIIENLFENFYVKILPPKFFSVEMIPIFLPPKKNVSTPLNFILNLSKKNFVTNSPQKKYISTPQKKLYRICHKKFTPTPEPFFI